MGKQTDRWKLLAEKLGYEGQIIADQLAEAAKAAGLRLTVRKPKPEPRPIDEHGDRVRQQIIGRWSRFIRPDLLHL